MARQRVTPTPPAKGTGADDLAAKLSTSAAPQAQSVSTTTTVSADPLAGAGTQGSTITRTVDVETGETLPAAEAKAKDTLDIF